MSNISINEEGRLQLQDLDKFCYFCDFEKVIHKHHIIPKAWGGLDEPSNLVSLCPNCHAMIHKRIYFLQFSQGFLILVNLKDHSQKILPSQMQRIRKREAPYASIEASKSIGKLKVDRLTEEVDNASI